MMKKRDKEQAKALHTHRTLTKYQRAVSTREGVPQYVLLEVKNARDRAAF